MALAELTKSVVYGLTDPMTASSRWLTEARRTSTVASNHAEQRGDASLGEEWFYPTERYYIDPRSSRILKVGIVEARLRRIPFAATVNAATS